MDADLKNSLQKFQHLKIKVSEIKSATNNFKDENRIGEGGFGIVYKGEVSHANGRSMAAIKRLNLDPENGQGIPEFLKEIIMLSEYKHENLISLLGYCCGSRELILVYEYASRGSLDQHLNSTHLTWAQRLKICSDAAKGLSYLHDPRDGYRRIIHCDIKSSNILLDDRWNAKISDLGLSIMGSANEQQSIIITAAAGTPGYLDPQYAMTHTLTKESDIYSFGVVLLEVLFGTLCCTYSNGGVEKLVSTWIESYREKKLSDIIFKYPTIQPLDPSSLDVFSDIAFRCLNDIRENRPKMTEVMTQLETALEIQEFSEWKPLFDYEEMAKTAEPPLSYNSKFELWKLLSKGALFNDGKTSLLINKKGDYSEIISFAECVDSGPSEYESEYSSRFDMGTYPYILRKARTVKTRVTTQFLLPLIPYAVNLLFKFVPAKKVKRCHPIFLKYKLQGETQTSISYLASERDDGWWMCELYQFTCVRNIVDLEIMFYGFKYDDGHIEAEGIEFRPLENVEHEGDSQPKYDSDSDTNWEEKLPADYEDIMKWSKNSVQWTTKKEAYSIICKGFLINAGQEWFSLDNNGKKCHMLSARAAGISGDLKCWLSLPDSRFGEAAQLTRIQNLTIDSKIHSQLLSSQTTYVAYLVYNLPEGKSRFEAPMRVQLGLEYCWYIYLVNPQTRVITPTVDQNTHNAVRSPKIKGLPKQRNDGWMEVQIWEFQTASITQTLCMHIELATCAKKFSGLIIQGIDFRPI